MFHGYFNPRVADLRSTPIYYTTPDGRIVEVTEVTQSPSPTAVAHGARYVGEVVDFVPGPGALRLAHEVAPVESRDYLAEILNDQ